MTALRLDSISHTFPGHRTPWSRHRAAWARLALDGLSLHVDHGEVVAMIGLNGAGKTTALRALAGRLRPDSGTAEILGHDAADLPRSVATQFGHMVDAPLVFADLTVTENLRAAARLHRCSTGRAEELASAARNRLGLDAWADVRARALSQGNRQRLAALAGATLATGPPSTPQGLGQATVTALTAGMLGIGLALPFAWVATITRSAFGTVGVLIAVIATTQVIVLLGAGSWFPYAASSLWTGMGGAEAAAAVGPPQLALTAAVGPVALVAVVRAWQRLTDV